MLMTGQQITVPFCATWGIPLLVTDPADPAAFPPHQNKVALQQK